MCREAERSDAERQGCLLRAAGWPDAARIRGARGRVAGFRREVGELEGRLGLSAVAWNDDGGGELDGVTGLRLPSRRANSLVESTVGWPTTTPEMVSSRRPRPAPAERPSRRYLLAKEVRSGRDTTSKSSRPGATLFRPVPAASARDQSGSADWTALSQPTMERSALHGRVR